MASTALVNSGEIAALGDKSHGGPWTAGIQHPRHKNAYLTLVSLADRCLATSGDYATPLSEGFRDHHLFDPRTGCSPATFSSVSVIAQQHAKVRPHNNKSLSHHGRLRLLEVFNCIAKSLGDLTTTSRVDAQANHRTNA